MYPNIPSHSKIARKTKQKSFQASFSKSGLLITNLIILFLFTPLILCCQDNLSSEKSNLSRLRSVKEVVDSSTLDKVLWSLSVQTGMKEYAPTRKLDAIREIDSMLSNVPLENQRKGQIKEFILLKKYKENIEGTLKSLKTSGKFVYLKPEFLPVHFALYGDSALSFIITGVFIEDQYNTTVFSIKERAAKVISTYILPSLEAFTESFSKAEIKYIGMTCIYGTINPSESGVLGIKSELVAFVAPFEIIEKYVLGEISDEELIDHADLYISDRDQLFEIRKIRIMI